MNKTIKVGVLFLVCFLYTVAVWTLFSPPLTLFHPALWLWISSIFIILGIGSRLISNKYFGSYYVSYLCLGIAAVCFLICGIGKIISLPVFHREEYIALSAIENVEIQNYQIGEADASWMSPAKAQALVRGKLEPIDPDAEFSDGVMQYVNQQPVFVFLASDKKKESHTVFMVDMKTAEVSQIETESPVLFTDTAKGRYKVSKNIRKNFPSAILGESHLELDDNQNPVWVTYGYGPAVSFMGEKQVKAIYLTDPLTGIISDYPAHEEPAWIDYAQPLELVVRHYNLSAKCSGSATHLAEDCILLPRGGQLYAFTNIRMDKTQNAGAAFINIKTGEIRQYAITAVPDNLVQEKIEEWADMMDLLPPTQPLLTMQEGEPYYVSPLYDKDGVIRQYILVDGNDAENYTTGTTWEETLNHWKTHVPPNNAVTDVPQGEEGDAYMLMSGIVESYEQQGDVFAVKLIALKPIYYFDANLITAEFLEQAKESGITFQYPPVYEGKEVVENCIPAQIMLG